jgi:hypothetical protein
MEGEESIEPTIDLEHDHRLSENRSELKGSGVIVFPLIIRFCVYKEFCTSLYLKFSWSVRKPLA